MRKARHATKVRILGYHRIIRSSIGYERTIRDIRVLFETGITVEKL
jgi:hypothetical protein